MMKKKDKDTSHSLGQQQQQQQQHHHQPEIIVSESNHREEFVPEAGLAKIRMKQYLETSNIVGGANGSFTNGSMLNGSSHVHEPEELQGKHLAKSLLAKWKSMESVKDKENGPAIDHAYSSSRNSLNRTRAISKDRQYSTHNVSHLHSHSTYLNNAHSCSSSTTSSQSSYSGGSAVPVISASSSVSNEEQLPQAGTARSLLNKWQNIDSAMNSSRERKGPRPITPPPLEELERLKNNEEDQTDANGKVPYNDELAIIGKGHAKSALAKFESQPLESNVNAVYTEEEVIPSAGMAKQLKNKFLTLEKEASKVETASSKMTYVPKKFTAPSSPTQTSAPATALSKKQNGSSSSTNGLLTTATASPNGQANGHSNQQNNGEKCCVCEKTVYAMEKIEADKKVYHKSCFKCTSCNCPLNDSDEKAVIHNNKPYCMKDSKALVESVKAAAAAANSPQGSPTKSAKKLDAIQVDTSVGGAKTAAKSPKSPAVADQQKLQSPAVNVSSTSPSISAAKSPKKLDPPATSSPKKQQPSPKTPVK